MRLTIWVVAVSGLGAACGGSTPPPKPPPAAPAPRVSTGPTRTDFKVLARKLVGRCVMGGWVERWRSAAEDPDVAKPRVHLEAFEDETGQDLDGDYLHSVLEQRMRLSGVYDVVGQASEADFRARGQIKRLEERVGGRRIPVYVAMLELSEAATGRGAHRCEAAVQGEI